MKILLSKTLTKTDRKRPVWSEHNPDGYAHAIGRDNKGTKTNYVELSERELPKVKGQATHFSKLVHKIF